MHPWVRRSRSEEPMRHPIATAFAVLPLFASLTSYAQQANPAEPNPPSAAPAETPIEAPPPVAPEPPPPPPPPPPPEAPPPPPPAPVIPATAAPAPAPAPAPAAPGDLVIMKSKFTATFYGAIEADAIWDSTESLNDFGGVAAIARPSGSYTGAAGHHRFTESIRNSRIGFRVTAPELAGLRTSALVEVDWIGNAPPTFQQTTGGVSEAGFWNNAGMRVRHVYLKMESYYVDLLFGQTWNLFGWQTWFHPLTVEIQGVPGQLFGRTMQLRLSHLIKTDAVNVEMAAAAVRAPQRDSGLPDGQGGLRLVINDWKGVHTAGGVGARSVD